MLIYQLCHIATKNVTVLDSPYRLPRDVTALLPSIAWVSAMSEHAQYYLLRTPEVYQALTPLYVKVPWTLEYSARL